MGRNHTAGLERVATVVIFVLLLIGGCGLSAYQCNSVAVKMGLHYSYGPIQGCMLKVDGKWVPKESYRVLGDVD